MCLLLLALVASCSAPAPSPRSATWNGRHFDELKLRYMMALDDRPADETPASVQMERALAREVDDVLRAHAAGTLRTEEDRARAGLVLVYDALLLQRNSVHAMRGKIDPAALPGDATARRLRGVQLLELARTLRPEDGRIASWLAATQGMADAGPDGAPTTARKDRRRYLRHALERATPGHDGDVEQGRSARCASATPGGAHARRCLAGRRVLALGRVREHLRLRELPRALTRAAPGD